jgi:DME family drug/metabolite transporter
VVTTVSMTVGALLLATVGSVAEPAPSLDGRSWLIVGWLAAVNTAFAFGLWSHTLRRLTAIESSVLNNTMAIQIPVLAWIFLGEVLSAQQIAGLLLAAVGAFWVQTRR